MKALKKSIRRLSDSIGNFTNGLIAVIVAVLKHGLSLIVLLIITLLFFVFPQTSDLLLILNQLQNQFIQVPLFFISLSVLAFLLSNLSDYLHSSSIEEIKQKRGIKKVIVPKDKKETQIGVANLSLFDKIESEGEFLERRVPKVLGTLLLLITSLAIVFLYEDVTKTEKFWYWIYLIVILLFLVCSLNQAISHKIANFFSKLDKKRIFSVVLAALLLLAVFVFGFINDGGLLGVKGLFGAVCSLAILFYLISVSYDEKIIRIKNEYGFPFLAILTSFIFLLYLYFMVYPEHARGVNPLTVITISLISLYTFFFFIKVIGALKKIPLLGFTLVILFIAGTLVASNDGFDHYKVSVSETLVSPKEYHRGSLKDYIRLWLNDRMPDITAFGQRQEKFPVIFVSSEGGGSRAGAWSFLVHSYLANRNPEYFTKHMFSMTGASGGAVGNAMFYAHVRQSVIKGKNMNLLLENGTGPLKYKASKVMSGNYLSSSVAALFGRDLIQSVIGYGSFDDRSKLLEQEWERDMAQVFNYPETQNPLKAPITDFNFMENEEYTLPLLLMNTSNLQTGEYGVFSSVDTESDKNNMGVFIDILGRYPNKNEAVKVSTTMSLAARFPYISPLGKIDGLGQFGDAGYYDNLGGGVTQRLEKAFRKVVEEAQFGQIKSILDIRHLVIVNEDDDPKIAYKTQLLGPVLTLLNTNFGYPEEMKKQFDTIYQIASKRKEIAFDVESINALADDEKKIIYPILPLGRYLSEVAVQSLEKCLEDSEIEKKLKSLVPKQQKTSVEHPVDSLNMKSEDEVLD